MKESARRDAGGQEALAFHYEDAPPLWHRPGGWFARSPKALAGRPVALLPIEDEFRWYGVGVVQLDFGRYMAVNAEGLYRSFDAALTGNDFSFERVEDRIS